MISAVVSEHHIKDQWLGAGDQREWSQIVSKTPSRLIQTRLPCHAWKKTNGHEVDCRCTNCQSIVQDLKVTNERFAKVEEKNEKRRKRHEQQVKFQQALDGMLKFIQVPQFARPVKASSIYLQLRVTQAVLMGRRSGAHAV